MSNTGFTFPPPPPPPPRRDFMPGPEPPYGRGSRGGSSNRGSDRAGGTRARGRGVGGGASRGNLFPAQRGGQAHYSRGLASSNSGFVGHREWSQCYSNRGASFNGASSYGAQQSQHQPGHSPTSPNSINHWNMPPKRDHATAFNHRGRGGSKPPAAPAVPSFLANIPGLSPPTPNALPAAPKSPVEKKPKPRTSNILGLNPSSQGPDSDEDDEDEEANLAASTAPTAGVSFEYNGQAATLKTTAEIAAWIADRKKCFPTAAKAAQAKQDSEARQKKWEEEKKANQEARRLQRESYEQEKAAKLQEVARGKKVVGWLNATEMAAKGPSGESPGLPDAAEKARVKTEKLVQKAAKAQRKLAKAQDALRKAQVAALFSASVKPAAEGSDGRVQNDGPTGKVTSETANDDELNEVIPTLDDDSDASSILTSDEETSSSGSSSDSDAAPESLTTKRTAPDRVAAPPRVPSNASHMIPCRNMTKYGQCRAGKKCRFSHDPNVVVELTRAGKPQVVGRQRRKGLWEVMVEREREEEARMVLGVIMGMGEGGMLGGGAD